MRNQHQAATLWHFSAQDNGLFRKAACNNQQDECKICQLITMQAYTFTATASANCRRLRKMMLTGEMA